MIENRISASVDQYRAIQLEYERAIKVQDNKLIRELEIDLVALKGQISALREFADLNRPPVPDDFLENWLDIDYPPTQESEVGI